MISFIWLSATLLFVTAHSNFSDCDASSPIPVVDLRPFLLGNITEQQQVVDQVTRALEGIGLVLFKNHGIPQNVVDNAFKMHREFFAESLEYKLKFRKKYNPDGSYEEFYGFTEIGGEVIYGAYPDYKEVFDVSMDVLFKHIYNNSEFPFPIQEYTEWALALRQRILTMSQLLSMALGGDRFYLSNIFDEDNNKNGVLRVAHYPPTPPKNDTFLMPALGPHTDYYPIVIGFQSSNSKGENQGFEAWDKLNKRWLKIPYIPNTMLLNIGDAMQIWSNNRFFANPHRINSVDHDRYSMYLFFGPKWNQIVDAKDFVNDNETEIYYQPQSMYDIVNTRLQKLNAAAGPRDDQDLGDLDAFQTDTD